MDLQTQLYMISGLGETSYAMNSQFQKNVMAKAKPFVEGTVRELYVKNQPKDSVTIADLGCSSGPNSLLVIHQIISYLTTLSNTMGHNKFFEINIILNDLYANDFNTIFKSLPSFFEKLKKDFGDDFGPCFVSATPGSFYGRLFPSETVHLVHSSYSLHYLSQVPPEIGNANKGNIYISETTPLQVVKAYLTQFQKDFSLFLDSRSQEMVRGGRMVLTLKGRRSADPTSEKYCVDWELLAQSLKELVFEGLLEEANLDSFNMPHYYPSIDEMKAVIQGQGSFNLDVLETFDVHWDPTVDIHSDPSKGLARRSSGEDVLRYVGVIRAVVESLIVNHFGQGIMENLFHKFAKHLGDYMDEGKGYNFNLVLCLSMKED